ncbi:hypothetical protein POJ06DRAFT_248399 [Lipomyces tetrasporus]|uniref:Uncharacterized protein n=1 Tax=Lipomyces tetrasporus TaxID=54092 RepID=A0AAD7QW48_9ASCO|nr:uncharacterized protein POJ06DRAFT_248399 [Lipomyces tetrasporus]KAJ8101976.1 hypothetical protein POJ06DRAFT_248399 [Lipomyces tetrasporus]
MISIVRMSILYKVLIILAFTVHVSVAAEYGRDYILSDGTIIIIPTITLLRANVRNETFMLLLFDNMTYIDNDAYTSHGQMVFSTFSDSRPHVIEPSVPLSNRNYRRDRRGREGNDTENGGNYIYANRSIQDIKQRDDCYCKLSVRA